MSLGYFQISVEVERKADDTPVTVVDREIESMVRTKIADTYPTHSIIGEEQPDKIGETPTHRWILDPIDGTAAFARGNPMYAVLLGLEIDGRCEVGAVYFPALNEFLCAASGLGAWWNGRRARVSETTSLGESFVSVADPAGFQREQTAYTARELNRESYHLASCSGAYGHTLVATGRAELALDSVMQPWDCAPFPPILREAGGFFGSWSGEETIYSGWAMSTTQLLLDSVLPITSK